MAKRGLKEIRVGGVIILALTMMIVFVFSIGGDKTLFEGKVKYKILFDSAAGLYEGDPVLLTGVEVGNVAKIRFPDDIETQKILVEVNVAKSVVKRIRNDSRAHVAAASLVYGKVVSITMGSADEPEILPGDFIETDGGGGFSAIADSTILILDDLRSVLSKIDHGDGMLGMILNEPMEMRQTFHYLSVSSQKLTSLLNRVEQGQGALGALLCDTTNFRKSLVDFQQITENLSNNSTVLGKLINDEKYGEAVMEDFKSTLQAIASITTKIDTGKGTAGQFVNDDALYLGLEDVVLGTKKSKVTKWLIQNRRKAGEKERMKQTEAKREMKNK